MTKKQTTYDKIVFCISCNSNSEFKNRTNLESLIGTKIWSHSHSSERYSFDFTAEMLATGYFDIEDVGRYDDPEYRLTFTFEREMSPKEKDVEEERKNKRLEWDKREYERLKKQFE